MITAISSNTPYCTHLSNEDITVCSDIAKERGGVQKAFRPHELLCAGYASCFHITLCMLLDRAKIQYDSVTVKVDLDRTEDGITKFLYSCDIKGNLKEEEKQAWIEQAVSCPIGKALQQTIRFEPIQG